MKDFVAIDFETANPKRVSACALGYTLVRNFEIIESKGYLMKPVGGHASFQSKIHGIKEEDTFDKSAFGELFAEIKDIFNYPLVAHSLFDKQVLNALSDHFTLKLSFEYTDTCSVAKARVPNLKNYKLKTLVRHFGIPLIKHHDATEDALACAKVFLEIGKGDKENDLSLQKDEVLDFKGIVMDILADNEVSYKEAYELLYWLVDHHEVAERHKNIHIKIRDVLEDDQLDATEEKDLRNLLSDIIASL